MTDIVEWLRYTSAEIERLRQRVAELEKERDEWKSEVLYMRSIPLKEIAKPKPTRKQND